VLGHDGSSATIKHAPALGVVRRELVFDPFFTVRERSRSSRVFRIRNNDAWIDELLHHLDLGARADANMRACRAA